MRRSCRTSTTASRRGSSGRRRRGRGALCCVGRCSGRSSGRRSRHAGLGGRSCCLSRRCRPLSSIASPERPNGSTDGRRSGLLVLTNVGHASREGNRSRHGRTSEEVGPSWIPSIEGTPRQRRHWTLASRDVDKMPTRRRDVVVEKRDNIRVTAPRGKVKRRVGHV